MFRFCPCNYNNKQYIWHFTFENILFNNLQYFDTFSIGYMIFRSLKSPDFAGTPDFDIIFPAP